MADKFFYKGIPSPNGTIVPDDIFDVLMPVCTGAEFKVLAYIVRRTFGFKKNSDSISLKQMVEGIKKKDGEPLDHGTGLSKATAAVAIKGLVEKGIIEAQRNRSKEKGDEPTTYGLRYETKQPVSKNQTRGGLKTGQGGVQKSDTQQTVLQQTVIQKSLTGVVKGGEESRIKELKDLDQPREKTEYVVQEILKQLGDKHSEKFYYLVAAKIPESVIRQALSEIKADGARHPAKVFTYRMKEYAMLKNRRGLIKNF
jgi:predicted transcriptional regulator